MPIQGYELNRIPENELEKRLAKTGRFGIKKPVAGGLYVIYLRAEGNSLVVYANPVADRTQWHEIARFTDRFCTLQGTGKDNRNTYEPEYFGKLRPVSVEPVPQFNGSLIVSEEQAATAWGGARAWIDESSFTGDMFPVLDTNKLYPEREITYLEESNYLYGSYKYYQKYRYMYYVTVFFTTYTQVISFEPVRRSFSQYANEYSYWRTTVYAPQDDYPWRALIDQFDVSTSTNSLNPWVRLNFLNNEGSFQDQNDFNNGLDIQKTYPSQRNTWMVREFDLQIKQVPGKEIQFFSQDELLSVCRSIESGSESDLPVYDAGISGLIPGMSLELDSLKTLFKSVLFYGAYRVESPAVALESDGLPSTPSDLYAPIKSTNFTFSDLSQSFVTLTESAGYDGAESREILDEDWAGLSRSMTLKWDAAMALDQGVDPVVASTITSLLEAMPGSSTNESTGLVTVPYTMGRDDWDFKTGEYVPVFVALMD